MTENKWTQGPYHVSGTDEGPGHRHLHIGSHCSATVLASMNSHHPDAAANARLLATSFEMYEALDVIIRCWVHHDEIGVHNRIREAIPILAKARGEQ